LSNRSTAISIVTDTPSAIDPLLAPFHQFGVNLGLSRIQTLLGALGSPHDSIPIIHVAGTNGKGSVCAYLASVLSAAGYRVGRYTSPHLVDWNERICIDGEPISTDVAIEILDRVIVAIDPTQPIPTQFEIVTAAMWLYFAESQVDLAVIEVGLGGRLDATNVCDRPLATAITSISIEHWQQLGNTLAKIASEKAGILKPHCPAIIGTLPPEAMIVVQERITTLNCPAVWVKPATKISRPDFIPESATHLSWAECDGVKYPLALLGEMQLTNSAIAIATIQTLRRSGWQISNAAIVEGMAKTQWLGRIQPTTWQGHPILIDGAHNTAAAIVLRQYLDTLNAPISWVIGMLSTKAHREIFQALLRPGDRLALVPVPGHSTAEPEVLAELARSTCPDLESLTTHPDLTAGLTAATAKLDRHKLVLCGSLYLLGYFLKLERD
jgi:dihydrofolate synthase / folylpolyglutamate synthase